MTDIVKRLRECRATGITKSEDLQDACDEIERLRASAQQALTKDLAREEAAYAAYLGIMVLRTMCKKAGLSGGEQRAKELLVEMGEAFPTFAGRSALRDSSVNTTQGERQTITLSYEERSRLLTILALARAPVEARYADYLDTLEAVAQRVSRLECQPGGCPYCNADRAREESENDDERPNDEPPNDYDDYADRAEWKARR